MTLWSSEIHFPIKKLDFLAGKNYLAKTSGLSILTLWADIKINNFELLQQNEVFRTSPPKILILQSVERGLLSRIRRWSKPGPCNPTPGLELELLPIKPQSIPTSIHFRNTKNTVLSFQGTIKDESPFDYALHFLNLGLLKIFRPGSGTSVEALPLSRGNLFSSKQSTTLLVLKDDFKKAHLSREDLSQMRCWILDRKIMIEQQYPTHLIVLIAPDKTSSYSEFIQGRRPEHNGLIEKIPGIAALPIPRIDLAIKQAIRIGTKDVYLPNDSHWGAAGNKIAAKALLDYLKKKRDCGRITCLDLFERRVPSTP